MEKGAKGSGKSFQLETLASLVRLIEFELVNLRANGDKHT